MINIIFHFGFLYCREIEMLIEEGKDIWIVMVDANAVCVIVWLVSVTLFIAFVKRSSSRNRFFYRRDC